MSSTEPQAGASRERLFFALWPDAAFRRAAGRVAARFGKRSGGRRIADDNLHVTLAFLGAVEPAQRTCLEAAADRVEVEPFSLTFDQVGYWPRPRILWLGVSQMPPPLLTLVTALQGGISECGLEPESRPYCAHLTLRRRLRRPPPRTAAVEPLSWPVEGFVLVRSDTRQDGAHYAVVRHWPPAI